MKCKETYEVLVSIVKIGAISHTVVRGINEFLSILSTFTVQFG